MNSQKIIIIGSGAAGLTAASTIRKYDANMKITIITKATHIAYSPCAIPYCIGNEIESFDDIVMHTKEDYALKGIKIITKSEVIDINSIENKLNYKSDDGAIKELKYDSLVISTGGTPFLPPIDGVNLKGVFKIKTIEDGINVKAWIAKTKRVVVAGAGAIGLETAYSLKQMGLVVTVVEMMPQILPRALDVDMAGIAKKYLEGCGIEFLMNYPIEKIVGTEKVEGVVVNGNLIDCEMVIMATGIRSNLELAKIAGVEIGKFAIKVNENMQTSISNIYAAGDCVEVIDFISNEVTLSPFGTTAVRQGKVVGANITNCDWANKLFKPVLNAMISKIGELEIGGTGYTEILSNAHGIEFIVGNATALTKARYYPDGKKIEIKIICDKNKRIIGGQIIGTDRVAERVDALTIAILNNVTIDDLANSEFCYAPPVSMINDPLAIAAWDACEKYANKF